mmetsp:Transcript_28577/g.60599  ORF Transcript_28577/g.60599 Transcript_28577/m.60599 type:complete len:276 (-) Transcript_28577:203-1030(-)
MTLSTVAYAGASSHQPASAAAAVRLFSLTNKFALNNHRDNRSTTSKVVHLVRHAEGTHNLSEEESKLPAHFDATLTPRGVEQCERLALRTKDLRVDAVLVSPLTRCLETSRLSFPHLHDVDVDPSNDKNALVPFVAHEEWRETVNYLCDCRRPTCVLEESYPRVSFGRLAHDHDPIWARYEKMHGSYADHTSMRESNDPDHLYKRAHSAWRALLDRPERNLALVGHSAFFMHMFTPLFEELEGVVQYEDDGVRDLMTAGRFDNCELRSVLVDIPI